MEVKNTKPIVCGEVISVIDMYGNIFRERTPGITYKVVMFHREHYDHKSGEDIKICYAFSHWKNEVIYAGPSAEYFSEEIEQIKKLGKYTPEFGEKIW